MSRISECSSFEALSVRGYSNSAASRRNKIASGLATNITPLKDIIICVHFILRGSSIFLVMVFPGVNSFRFQRKKKETVTSVLARDVMISIVVMALAEVVLVYANDSRRTTSCRNCFRREKVACNARHAAMRGDLSERNEASISFQAPHGRGESFFRSLLASLIILPR